MSAIYEGTLKHTRTKPKKHAFEYQVRLLYLDLDDLKNLKKLVSGRSLMYVDFMIILSENFPYKNGAIQYYLGIEDMEFYLFHRGSFFEVRYICYFLL